MRKQWKSGWHLGLAILAIFGTLLAQPRSAPALDRGANLRADVDIVLVNVTVVDSAQKVLTGLHKEDFHILDNRKEQRIRYFSTEDVPISLTIVLDASGSMETKLPKAIRAATRLFEFASPGDDCRLSVVRGTPEKYLSPEELEDVHRMLDGLKSKGYTALWDSMYKVASDLEKRAQYPRKAMVVISDGGDNRSRYTEKELRRFLQETNVQVYVVGLYNPFSRFPEERSGPASLDDLANSTGGRMYTAMDSDGLLSSIEKINRQLRNQYVLGYTPNPLEHDGKWRKVKVTVRVAPGKPKLHVDARPGYFMPGE